jgi:glycine oxidase
MKCLSSSNSKAASCTVKSSATGSSAGKKIAILGGGLAGRLLAWRLASCPKTINATQTDNNIDNGIKSIAEIQVFEKGSLTPHLSESDKAAAFTAAAMISPMSELVASELDIYHLGQASLALWPQWLEQLGCLQHFHQHGSLVLAHPNDLAELHQFKRDLDYKLTDLKSENLPLQQPYHDPAPYQMLSGQHQIAELEPGIGPNFQQGLFLKDEAHIDHHPVLARLVEQAQALGVQFHPNHAVDINDSASSDSSLSDFDIIFDCRGMGSKADPMANSLRGVRGEVIWLECKEISLTRPIRLMHPRYKLYVVPKPNHQFIIGATEIESEDTTPISLRSSMELLSALYAINPAFAEARILAQDCNLRPAYIDNLPKIEQQLSGSGQPIICINGLYRHGYLIGPAIIEQAIQKAFL